MQHIIIIKSTQRKNLVHEFNTAFNNILVITCSQFYWWWKQVYQEKPQS